MLIAFFVNDLEREYEGYTTTILAYQAMLSGHRVCYVTPSDFVLTADDHLQVHGRFLPKKKYKDRAEFFATLKSAASKTERVDVEQVDVLMLRNDPSLDAQDTPWAAEAGILWGREAVKRGVIVVNDPDSLGRAVNKLYFQSFPEEARAETLISRHEADIKAFAKDAIYLRGFRAVIDLVASGVSLDPFWLGKIAPSHLPVIEELLQRGLVSAPRHFPEFLARDDAKARIAGLRKGHDLASLLSME